MSGETLYLAIFCNQSDEDTVPDNEVYRCVLEVRNGIELPDTNKGGFNDIDEIAEIHEAYGSERVWLVLKKVTAMTDNTLHIDVTFRTESNSFDAVQTAQSLLREISGSPFGGETAENVIIRNSDGEIIARTERSLHEEIKRLACTMHDIKSRELLNPGKVADMLDEILSRHPE